MEISPPTPFICKIQASLYDETDFQPIDVSLYDKFRPNDLLSTRVGRHQFGGMGIVKIQDDSEDSGTSDYKSTPRMHAILKTASENEAFYELQLLMCCPAGFKSEDGLTVNMSVRTPKGEVTLRKGMEMSRIANVPQAIDAACCFRPSEPKHDHYLYRLIGLCRLQGIVNNVYFSQTQVGPDPADLITEACVKLVVSGTVPAREDLAVKAHFNHMRAMLLAGSYYDAKLNGIPCSQFQVKIQSDVLTRLVEMAALETEACEISIPESKEAAMALLMFLYCGPAYSLTPLSSGLVMELVGLGHRLNVPLLVLAGVKTLLGRPAGLSEVHSGTIWELVEFSEKAGFEDLSSTLFHIVQSRRPAWSEVRYGPQYG